MDILCACMCALCNYAWYLKQSKESHFGAKKKICISKSQEQKLKSENKFPAETWLWVLWRTVPSFINLPQHGSLTQRNKWFRKPHCSLCFLGFILKFHIHIYVYRHNMCIYVYIIFPASPPFYSHSHVPPPCCLSNLWPHFFNYNGFR